MIKTNASDVDAGQNTWQVGGFVAIELVFLALAHHFGGPPWVVLGVVACISQIVADFRATSLIGLLPALGWLAASHTTGNRELFFPYAMYLAAHGASQFASRGWMKTATAGAVVLVAFLGIRVLQSATLPVLMVEFFVAAAILAATTVTLAAAPKRAWTVVAVATVASAAAYAGLAL